MSADLYIGDNVEIMDGMAADSFDAVVCDPPYGLEFMQAAWDTFKDGPRGLPRKRNDWGDFGSREHPRTSEARGRIMRNKGRAFQEFNAVWLTAALHVLQPGGLLLAFGAPRTYHRLACAAEEVGFEVHDSIHWIYGQGRPSSKGRLKPNHEPIIVARKPGSGSLALDIEACRVSAPGEHIETHGRSAEAGESKGLYGSMPEIPTQQSSGQTKGRWPPNVVLGHAPGCRQVGHATLPGDKRAGQAPGTRPGGHGDVGADLGDGRPAGPLRGAETVATWDCAEGCPVATMEAQQPGAARFYAQFQHGPDDWAGLPDWATSFLYHGKAATSERDAGLLGVIPCHICGDKHSTHHPHPTTGRKVRCRRNTWPAVKPLGLMRLLVRLAGGGRVLDPFAGTGTTLAAAQLEGIEAVGIEQDRFAAALALGRIGHWSTHA